MEFLTENVGILIGSLILFFIFLVNILEVKRCTNNKAAAFLITFSLTIYIVLLPIIVILLGIFTIYYLLINLILKIKFGKKFCGLLNGADSFHMLNESTHSVIHCLILAKCITKRSPDDFFNSIKQILWKLHRHSKFKMLFHKKFGYYYMLDGDLRVDDCIKKLKTINCQQRTIEKKDLLMLLNDYSNSPLPKNKTLGWEILVGTQLVNWNGDECEYYPLLMRINHAVTDIVTIMKLMVELSDRQDVNITKASSPNVCDSSNTLILREYFSNICINLYSKIQQILKLIIRSFYVVLLSPASVISNCIFKGNDCNILYKHLVSGKEILALDIEKSQKYVLKIKQIKNKIPGTRFSDVIITAFSASLTQYFEKNLVQPPQCVTATVPVLDNALNIQHAIPGKFITEKVKNGYSFYLMNLPIGENKQILEMPLIKKLQIIKNESSILRNSSDYCVNFLINSYINSVLPHPVKRFLLSRFRWTTGISIIPGCPKVRYCDGLIIFSDMVLWVPHTPINGTMFVINTHDNRLHMGFSVDKTLIDNQTVAQTIVDGVYKYLDLLADEVEFVYPDIV